MICVIKNICLTYMPVLTQTNHLLVLETGRGLGQFQLIGRVRVQFLINWMMNLVIGSTNPNFIPNCAKKASPSIEANSFPDRLNLKKPDRSNLKKRLASN